MSGLVRGWIVTALEQLPMLVPTEMLETDFPPEARVTRVE